MCDIRECGEGGTLGWNEKDRYGMYGEEKKRENARLKFRQNVCVYIMRRLLGYTKKKRLGWRKEQEKEKGKDWFGRNDAQIQI